MDNRPVLEVENLSIAFKGLQVLTDVNFQVQRQEILGLVGPNGAGKTVLLNCINNIYHPDQGTVRFEGEELGPLPRHRLLERGISRTFQQIELFRDMTVIENALLGLHPSIRVGVAAGGVYWGRARKREAAARRKVEEMLDFLELYPYRKERVGNLSFGVQKLVGLSRALVSEPRLVLLDEIASGLNREEKEDLARFLLRIYHEKKVSLLWVEHDMQLITELADRMVCLNYGVKIAEGTPQAVVTDPNVVEAYLGAADGGAAWPTRREVGGGGSQ